jgi:hypothetical protein
MPLDLRQSPRIQRQTEPDNQVESFQYSQKSFQQPETASQEEVENNQVNDSGKILHQWRAPEFEVYEKSARWYLIAFIFMVALIAYALIINAPIMAITFILLGIVGYIHAQKDPRVITFTVTSEGIIADKEMYPYENINSFWIFYEPPYTKTISLHTKASMLPYVHIPIQDEDPAFLHELLSQYIPEIKQETRFVDTLERVLHI